MSNSQEEKLDPCKFVVYQDDPESFDVEESMGVLGGSAFVLASIMGTGIFISVSDTFNLFSSSNILVVILLWIFGGFVSMIGSLCYAELGSRFLKSGGECMFYKEALGKSWSVLYVIMSVFVVKTLSLASLALIASTYLVDTFLTPGSIDHDDATKLIAIVFLVISVLFNFLNEKIIMKCLAAFSCMKLITLIGIISLGVYSIIKGDTSDLEYTYQLEGFDMVKFSSALVGILWSFEGWNSLALKSRHVRNPSINLPLSNIIGVSAITFIYILVVVSYSSVLGYSHARISETIALSFAKLTMGPFYPVISIIVFLSALGSAVSNLHNCAEVTAHAGYEGILPSFFLSVYKESTIPPVSVILMTIVSISFVFIKFQTLINLFTLLNWWFYFLSFTCMLIMKYKTSKLSPTSTVTKIFHSANYLFIILIQIFALFVVGICFYNDFFGCLTFALFMLSVFSVQFFSLY